MYTTMQPCFGCAKELVQAKIAKVSYLHPWVPTDVDPAMDKAKKAEYEKILAKLDVEHLDGFVDPVASWAVTSLRSKVPTPKPKTVKKARRAAKHVA